MKGDFTRRTFRRTDRYRGVLLQQGRVALDADWNEQHEIQRYHDETTARDAIGAHGAPVGAAGFQVTDRDGEEPRECTWDRLTVSNGRYYVDGILCENDLPLLISAQPDLPGVPEPLEDGRYVVYLDVWSEHVTALEDPRLLEVALGGADTATRARTVWQVRVDKLADHHAVAEDVAPPWTPAHTGDPRRLRARAVADPDLPAALVPPSAGYRGLRNQLYRVEIHDGGDRPTFVWSRDNGSVTALVAELASDTEGDHLQVRIDAPPRDAVSGFPPGCWVELVDQARTRRGEPGFLGRVSVSSDVDLTVGEWAGPTPEPLDLVKPVVLRRWDSEGALPVEDGWVDIEDGLSVQFSTSGFAKCGDHWLVPARTVLTGGGAGGGVEWPTDDRGPSYLPPDGIVHDYAAIALLDLRDRLWTRMADCRATFAPLAQARADPASHVAPGLHVERVGLARSRSRLENDRRITQVELMAGLTVEFDGTPVPLGGPGRSPLTVTLDLPHFESDVIHGGDIRLVLGTRPLVLDGIVTVERTQLLWRPTDVVHDNMANLVSDLHERGVEQLLCTLRIDGRSVVDSDHPYRMLNGLAIHGARADGTVEQLLPTVDDVRGADFSTWFWLDMEPQSGAFGTARFGANTFGND
ncbi:DUF6519 domain-containing protein [Actinophytocola oryzae]|uniref:Uncharacterized protein n=1 Tax=Actinophytocola oryzae TaxID=502181 RepID=A0A4V3FSU1_9PSEU|nr:DUF6519 domain-containing protein [Actinophytocola oryzae]TDV48771.1 hypothetical protein CLV71_108131 [Actinophytocola oryzae]